MASDENADDSQRASRVAAAIGGRRAPVREGGLKFLSSLTEIGVRVLRHDVAIDETPGEFDLVRRAAASLAR